MDIHTIEEAVENQGKVHAAIDAGEYPHTAGESWRAASLKFGYSFKPNLLEGTGYYAHRPDGTICPWQGEWFADGTILLCTECFLDGT